MLKEKVLEREKAEESRGELPENVFYWMGEDKVY